MKTLHFISGLPRSGSTLIANLLKQNPNIHGEAVSSLSSLFGTIHANWDSLESNLEYKNEISKYNVLYSILQGYYKHIDKSIIFDKDRGWVALLPLLEHILQTQVKMIICVRNPAEIVSSFEKLRKENPLFFTRADKVLREGSNITTRAYYYAGPEGPLGMSHQNLKDAITMGYLNRFLFVDYNRFCSTPRSQMKRIYDFFELSYFDHDFENIIQLENYNDVAVGLPNLHKIKPSVNRTTVNVVEYLGLDLYEVYNKDIFWNAWI